MKPISVLLVGFLSWNGISCVPLPSQFSPGARVLMIAEDKHISPWKKDHPAVVLNSDPTQGASAGQTPTYAEVLQQSHKLPPPLNWHMRDGRKYGLASKEDEHSRITMIPQRVQTNAKPPQLSRGPGRDHLGKSNRKKLLRDQKQCMNGLCNKEVCFGEKCGEPYVAPVTRPPSPPSNAQAGPSQKRPHSPSLSPDPNSEAGPSNKRQRLSSPSPNHGVGKHRKKNAKHRASKA